ncbi:MAG: Eco57I restriction-modification methylase domain-containing protein [Salinivirgaceae bacterium]|nr:Eco57I restriction-modification methylase domain-containing protein [Salinivirgaceae bacterium]
MQETVLYYMRERVLGKNIELKHIVITDGFQWFVFEAAVFEKYFFGNKDLQKHYNDFEVNPTLFNDKTSMFYNEIASPIIDKVKNDLDYVYFDIRNLTDQRKISVYKLLSPQHLLRRFVCNDSNELNAPFYNELLYIIGLEEVADGNKRKICRLKPSDRNHASIIENAINQIEDTIIGEERQFEIALSLAITWINRILFLKLLESQLVNYHKGDAAYRFLNSTRIGGFDDLHELFFKVLAVPTKDRKPEVAEKYRLIPYLNSSLFEMAENEDKFRISGLRDDAMPVHNQTILYDNRNSKRLKGELKVLDYLFRFLDAYDFGSEPDDDSLTRDNRKSIINASVLGLIFEKINGYKDGSFFTPGVITQYMCRESLRRAVVQKFNDAKGWQCQTFDELADKDLDKTEANHIINSLRICDPAVGSGHFLVSVLNELIAIKADLKVLLQTDGKRLKFGVNVENDELMIDDDGEPFVYNPKNAESQMVQESLFAEKRAIIENCLFGVDINPNSVNICRLRLWIELLKNAYYKQDGEFETLPNIDINIKCGNSLVSRYPVKIGHSIGSGDSLSAEIKNYKACVKSYKYENDKAEKKKVKDAIKRIKEKIVPNIQFKLELDASYVAENREAMENNIYRNSMEWMIEFPEVLDDEGRFNGFDVVIGNPPYGVSIKGEYRKELLRHIGKVPDYEIYYYFVEHSRKIIKHSGILSFIIPNTWLFNVYAIEWKVGLFNKWDLLQVLDCTKFKIFEEATVRNTIVLFRKTESFNHIVTYKNTKDVVSFESLIAKKDSMLSEQDIKPLNVNWGLAFSLPENIVLIVNKIKSNGEALQTYFPEYSQGMIAYDKYKGQDEYTIKNRIYHHFEYKDGYKKWLWGEDVKRYLTIWNGKEYIDYCSGIANPRQPKYFMGKRLLVREITNPSIYANIVDEELYNDPAVLIVLDSKSYSLEVALAIFNSKLATFYHFNHSPKATKGDFPKIIIEDLKTFPLPPINADQRQPIIDLVNQILEAKKQDPQANTESLEREIDIRVYKLYGLTLDEAQVIDASVTAEEFDKY